MYECSKQTLIPSTALLRKAIAGVSPFIHNYSFFGVENEEAKCVFNCETLSPIVRKCNIIGTLD